MTGMVTRIGPDDRSEGPATPGMAREEAIATEGMWAGFVRTDPDLVSGWHHHGEYHSAIYVLAGSLQMEFGPGGSESLEAGPGDFLHIPKRAIHRERNPSAEEGRFIVVRAGTGESLFNVDGPE